MQCFRLWQTGLPDKVIVFDSLPEEFLYGIERTYPDGLPRYWKKWLDDNSDGKFYALNYLRLNKDIESWQHITSYVRKVCNVSIRLMDKIEDMAKPLAENCKIPPTLEPEQIPVIPIPKIVSDVPIIPVPIPKPAIAVPIQESTIKRKQVPRSGLKHTCTSKGHGGLYANIGTCPRCDELRAARLVPA